jgi:hypothetical protein
MRLSVLVLMEMHKRNFTTSSGTVFAIYDQQRIKYMFQILSFHNAKNVGALRLDFPFYCLENEDERMFLSDRAQLRLERLTFK